MNGTISLSDMDTELWSHAFSKRIIEIEPILSFNVSANLTIKRKFCF